MASNSTAAANSSSAEIETVIISDVSYEIPKAVADLLMSGKLSSDANTRVVFSIPKTARSVESGDGIGIIDEKEKIDDSVLVGGVAVDLKNSEESVKVTEQLVNPEGVINTDVGVDEEDKDLDPLNFEMVRDVLANPEGVDVGELILEKDGDVLKNTEGVNAGVSSSEKADGVSVSTPSVEVKNPGGVVDIPVETENEVKTPGRIEDSDNTDLLFGCSPEKEVLPKEIGEPSVVVEKSKQDKILDDLVKMGSIANIQDPEDTGDCEIIETSSTASKRKVSRPTPLRRQPVRSGKRPLEVKEETDPKSSVKRAKKSKSVVEGKEILQELECSERFLMTEGLVEVFDLIKAQGWEKLCETQEFVCPEVVQEFYRNLSLIEGAIPALEVKFKGKKFTLSSMELAMILGLDHKGFDVFCKHNQWPKEAGEKLEMVKRICQLESIPKNSGISTQFMEPSVKIMHKLLVSNFLQRGVKPSYVQHEDLLLLDKLLKKERINLPKLMIHQMYHLRNLSQIGFSRVIKKVLQEHEMYESLSGVEEPVVKDFDQDIFRKMNLVKDSVQGWIRTSVPESEFGGKLEFKEGEDDDLDQQNAEFEQDVDKWMAALEKNISDVREDMKAVRTDLKEFKEMIKQEIKEMKNAFLDLVDKL